MTDKREALENHAGGLHDGRSELEVDLDELRLSSAEAGEIETALEGEIETLDARPDAPEGRQDEAELEPAPPLHSSRGKAPGPRGCWAINARGEPCGSFKRRDSDYCNGHAGVGVASDPTRYSPIAHDARRRQLQARAELRMLFGDRGRIGPRTVLREEVARNAKRIAGTAVNAALDPSADPIRAGKLALELIREADPLVQAEISVSGNLPQSDEEIEAAIANGSILDLVRSGAFAPPAT
jgi:hypothetical protein